MPNLGQIPRFLEPCDLEIWRITLKKNKGISYLGQQVIYFSCSWWTVNMVSVVPLLGSKLNCISSMFTVMWMEKPSTCSTCFMGLTCGNRVSELPRFKAPPPPPPPKKKKKKNSNRSNSFFHTRGLINCLNPLNLTPTPLNWVYRPLLIFITVGQFLAWWPKTLRKGNLYSCLGEAPRASLN